MFLIAAISLGFLGSLHCIGMCGPIALALPFGSTSTRKQVAGILIYNMGRVTTYSVLGLIFGLIGQGIAFAGWQDVLSVTVGSLILLFLFVPAFKKIRPRYNLLYRLVEKVKNSIRRLFKKSSPVSFFFIGVLNGLLPCGLVYLAIAGSLVTGSIGKGALFMAGFGLGTIPAMLSLSLVGRFISVKFRQQLRRAVPVFAGLMALMLILRGLNLNIPYVSPHISTNAQGTSVQSCCHK